MKILSVILLILGLAACCAKRPIQKLYCVQMDSTGKHCAIWAKHEAPPCVHDAYGDCTANSK